MEKVFISVLAFWNGIVNDEKEKGATAVEYGLLVALIAAVIIGTVVTLGGQINSAFQTISTKL
ncbi:pilus assembly protein Flp/PilA [Sinomonas atrocyanea]|uniref:Flp family type IVb pilin n=1 Tax=Sinomonas atrocyanea TaxID=37927 RepID=UPI0027870E6D|nr:Flp family type IVb pilin [Sinomonas atrocyanea]MDQ0258723.1 pilus assembly protein Flp/PilA [Sinomonas atrocyanea]